MKVFKCLILSFIIANVSSAYAQLLPDLPDGITGQELVEMIPRQARGFPALVIDEEPAICAAFLEGARANFMSLSARPLGEQDTPWPSAKTIFPFDLNHVQAFFTDVKAEKNGYSRSITAQLGEYDIDRDGVVEGILISSIWPSWWGPSYRVDWLPHDDLVALKALLSNDGALTEQAISELSPLLGDAFAPRPERKRTWHRRTNTPSLIIGPGEKLYSLLDGLSEVTLNGPKQICTLNKLPQKMSGFDPYQFFQGNKQRTVLDHDGRRQSLINGSETALSALVYNVREAQGLECGGGTLNAHSRLQGANVGIPARALLQPWKLPIPYNERGDVSAALEHWSFGDPWSRRVYLDMLATYPRAQVEVKARLIDYFDIDASEPYLEAIADELLYRVVGEHFTFGRNSGYVHELRDAKYTFVQNLYRGELTPETLAKQLKHLIAPHADVEKVYQALGRSRLLNDSRWSQYSDNEAMVYGQAELAKAVMFAVLDKPDLLQAAITAGLPVDAATDWGKTALMYAAQLGYEEAVSLLLAEGADPRLIARELGEDAANQFPYADICVIPRPAPRTVLEYALQSGKIGIVEMILRANGLIDESRLSELDLQLLFPKLNQQSRALLAARLQAASRPLAEAP